MKKAIHFLLFFVFLGLSFQGYLCATKKTLERDYSWASIPAEWHEWGVEHTCIDEDDLNDEEPDSEDESTINEVGCWVSCNDICAECFLYAYSPEFSNKPPYFPKSCRAKLPIEYLPSVGWSNTYRGECVVCQNLYDSGEIERTEVQKPCYSGHLHFTYNGGFPFLQRQLEYTRKYPKYQAYWVETSVRAEQISEVACKRFRSLVASTALKALLTERDLQKDFPTGSWYFKSLGYCLPTSLASQCFRFSDYYQVTQDIEKYCQSHFTYEESEAIQEQLDDLLDALAPLFMGMYTESMTLHPTPEVAEEVDFLNNRLGNNLRVIFPLLQKPSSTLQENIKQHKSAFALDRDTTRFESPDSSQPGWFLANLYLSKGEFFNDLILHQAAIETLSKAIQYNPQLANAYIERAHAYFELGNVDKAMEDYKKYKELRSRPLITIDLQKNYSKDYHDYDFLTRQMSLYGIDHPIDFSQGLCAGTLEGAAVGVVTFVPSTLGCLRGILNGLWSFACSPKEVSQEVIHAAHALIQYIRTHNTNENLALLVPELRELCERWDHLSDQARGHKIGYIIGKYGVDIFAPGTAVKAISKYRTLKRANTVMTLECCALSNVKRATVLEESNKRALKRQNIIEEARVKNTFLVTDSNRIKHIMQPKHAWGKLVTLSGNVEEDFKKVIMLLEDNQVLVKGKLIDTISLEGGLMIKKDYEIVIDTFTIEINTMTNTVMGETNLVNAFVRTKP